MEKISSYIISVSFSIVFCVLVEIFTPTEKYAKLIRMVSGIFIVYILISPIRNLIDPENYRFDAFRLSNQKSDVYKIYEEKTLEVFNNTFCEFCENTLKEDIKITFNENNTKVIVEKDNLVKISGVERENRDDIYKYVVENYNIKPRFTE